MVLNTPTLEPCLEEARTAGAAPQLFDTSGGCNARRDDRQTVQGPYIATHCARGNERACARMCRCCRALPPVPRA